MSDKLPEQQSNSPQKQSGQVLVTETSVNFSPLPPAQELERLNQIQPGIVERILRMAELEQEIRHEPAIKTKNARLDNQPGVFSV